MTLDTLQTELLERVLLHLPVRDLLLDQRVCHRWSTLINESPTIQTALFFQPPSTPSTPGSLNPLLKEVFPAWFEHSRWRSKDDFPTKPSLNAIVRKEASWRKMLVVSGHPEGTELIREIGAADRGADDGSRQSVKGMEVRMGLLYDICYQWCTRVDNVFVVRYYPEGLNGEWKIRLVMYHPENWFLANYRSSGMPDNRAVGFEKHRSEAADDAPEINWGKVEYTHHPFGQALR